MCHGARLQVSAGKCVMQCRSRAPTQLALAIDANLKYRVPMAPALDGNTVDTQLEQAAFAENSVRYQATLTFLNARLKELMTAIVGQ